MAGDSVGPALGCKPNAAIQNLREILIAVALRNIAGAIDEDTNRACCLPLAGGKPFRFAALPLPYPPSDKQGAVCCLTQIFCPKVLGKTLDNLFWEEDII